MVARAEAGGRALRLPCGLPARTGMLPGPWVGFGERRYGERSLPEGAV
jgi:hypothetical protein